MQKIIFFFFVSITLIVTLTSCNDIDSKSYINKIVVLDKPGSLANALFLTNMAGINTLKISGKMDSRDFKTIRDHMTELLEIDLSNATIEYYKGYEGTGGAEIYEYPANTLPIYAFYNSSKVSSLTSLNKITLPLNLKSIGSSAFTGCTGLTIVDFPADLKNIGDRCFARCSALSNTLAIPSKVDSIGYSAFAFCTALTALQLSDSLLFIGESAFNGCSGLSGTLNLPSKLITIKERAFENCSSLSTINISSALANLENSVFQDCTCPINVASDNPNFSSVDGVLFDYSQSTIIYFPPSKTGNYDIPVSVSSIGYGAFANCKNLTSISIPTSIIAIGDYAFYNCSGLTGTFSIPNSVFAIGLYAFVGCNKITEFNVTSDNVYFFSINGVIFSIPQTPNSPDDNTPQVSSLVQFPAAKSGTYEIPSTVNHLTNTYPVVSISPGAFIDCSMLDSVNIPASITSIGNRAFMNCTNLNYIRSNSTTPDILINNDFKKTISYSVFDNINKKTCKLYVPANSVGTYRNANQWSDFRNISGI
ncbi:MAG: leucine-rich repeat domain-containing protein [Paludibacter sp.]